MTTNKPKGRYAKRMAFYFRSRAMRGFRFTPMIVQQPLVATGDRLAVLNAVKTGHPAAFVSTNQMHVVEGLSRLQLAQAK